MGFTDGYRYWSILQVVAIILCYSGSASDNNADMMDLIDERSTDDENLSPELETTTYEKQTTIQDFFAYTDVTIVNVYTNAKAEPESTEANTQMITSRFIVAIVCVVVLVVLFAIVTIVSFIVFQRRKRKGNPSNADKAKMSDLETDGYEVIYMNEKQGTSLDKNAGSTLLINTKDDSEEIKKDLNNGANHLETATSEYCDLEGVTRGRIQGGNEYEQLDHRRNYEPVIVYEL